MVVDPRSAPAKPAATSTPAAPTAAATPIPAQQLFAPALGQRAQGARLAGRRILIVGAGQRRIPEADPPVGNGRAMAVLFAREGAAIACADKDFGAAQDTVDWIVREGGTAHALQADVGQPAQIDIMVQRARDVLGGLDGLVLNVGIGNTSRFGTETAEAWDQVMDVNLRAHMLGAQAAAAVMNDGGAIVFISSIAALTPLTGIPAYEASKAALAAVCRATALACHAHGIRANVVAPGMIDTPVGRDASRDRPGRATQPVPFGRLGTGWEVAHAALFLISTESSYVNAQVLVADGGLSIAAVRPPA
jgi:NAD(P)-dependent dehydrogenase (short-subunit alcohol dehydrogenase family)